MIEKSPTPEPTPETIYRAGWICPVDQPPIENGVVVISSGKIRFVGRANDDHGSSSNIVDLGDGAIVPGLINAHSHLEFSDLAQPLGQSGIKFTDWVRLIVRSRMESNADSSERKSAAIKSGVEQSVLAGVAAVGEIATDPFQLTDYSASSLPMSIQFFLEQLGSDAANLPTQRSELSKFMAQTPNANQPLEQLFGASPHAPYSCHPKLIEQICEQAKSENRIVAMHLAETLEERELLANQSGDFVDLLKDFGAWNPELFPSSRSILSTLQTLSTVRSLVVHGNYLNDTELDFIASNTDRMTIVFCPRTHKFFGHTNYPMEKILRRKINVAIGTDSLASNPDLDLFEELKLIAAAFPAFAAGDILEMGTRNGSQALGIESNLGTIAGGKSAVLSFVSNSEAKPTQTPDEWLFGENSTCVRVI